LLFNAFLHSGHRAPPASFRSKILPHRMQMAALKPSLESSATRFIFRRWRSAFKRFPPSSRALP